MKSNRELRAFIREVLTSATLRESVDPDEITIGMKLSDKEGGTPVAVIVGFMNEGEGADIFLGTSQKTPVAKVYSQALGNKQLEIPAFLGKSPVKSVSYNYNPVESGVGRYLTVQEAKDSSFTYDMSTDEGNWLATFLSAVGNIGATASVETKSVAYALNVMDITREEAIEGSVSDGTFFNASQLFIPYPDKLFPPSFRYTQQAQAEKSTACLLTQQEFLNKLPAYVAYLTGGPTSTPGSKLYLSSLDASRMNMCSQQGTQGALYKIGTLVVSAILQRFGIPMGLSYGVAQILPAIGPMAYHAETGNIAAFTFYIFQISADIAGSVTGGFTPAGITAIISDIVCSILLDKTSSPGFAEKVKLFIDQKNPESIEDLISLSRDLSASDHLDPQDLKSLVPTL